MKKTRHLDQGVRDLIRMLMTYLQVFSQPCCFSLISTGYPFPSKSPEITRPAAFLWGLFVRRLTRWISQIIAAKVIQCLPFKVFSLGKLFSAKTQSLSLKKCKIFDKFPSLFTMLILAFLISSDVCSVKHYLVLCWKICLFPPFRLQILQAKKFQILYFKNIDFGGNYQRFSFFDFRWSINRGPSL